LTFANPIFGDRGGGKTTSEKTLDEALKEHSKALMSLPGVVGTALGLCEGRTCIKVYVVKKTPELTQKISDTLAGYPVDVEETGEIRALPKNRD
jgi:hypothetical protein